MKTNLLFILCLLFGVSSVSAQKNSSKKKSTYNFEIKGGVLFDIDYRLKSLPDPKATVTNNTYTGFNYAAIAIGKIMSNTRAGVELDFYKFRIIPPFYGVVEQIFEDPLPDYIREKVQIQASFYYGKSILQSERFDIFVAPLVGLAYRIERHVPSSSFGFPIRDTDYLLGVGGKLQGRLNLSKKIGVVFGTKVMLLDFMIRKERTENPNLTLQLLTETLGQVDILRRDVVLQLGMVFDM